MSEKAPLYDPTNLPQVAGTVYLRRSVSVPFVRRFALLKEEAIFIFESETVSPASC